jgi:putative restriction endonuclease
VRGYVANTDYEWFRTLVPRPEVTEVNFWQPSHVKAFRAISPGHLLFFRLKSPRNAIGGFAVFARHAVLPAWHAWDTFGEANGARTRDELFARIERYRRRSKAEFVADPHGNYLIGCILLVEPVFFAPEEWVAQPADWHPNIVQGKSYDLTAGEGARMARECLERIGPLEPPTLSRLADESKRYGVPGLIAPRLGQATFRVAVEEAYGRACAVTWEHSLPVLEAAHIRPYEQNGQHTVSNGLLLRRDIHRLFDLGYATVSRDHRFRVSRRLAEEFHNGKTYYALDGARVEAPKAEQDWPDRELLQWHRETVFRG